MGDLLINIDGDHMVKREECIVIGDESNSSDHDKQYIPRGNNSIVSNVTNNWTAKNTGTVEAWKTDIMKMSFIYNYILGNYKWWVDQISLWVLILSAIATIMTAVSSTLLSTGDISNTSRYINFVLFFVSTITVTLNGVIKIKKWDEMVTMLATFDEKLDAFYATISNELLLPDALRTDAIEFITKQQKAYLNILQQIPDVLQSDFIDANKKFEEDTTTHYKYSQKFSGNDHVIDIE